MLASIIKAKKKYYPETLLEESTFEIKRNQMGHLINNDLNRLHLMNLTMNLIMNLTMHLALKLTINLRINLTMNLTMNLTLNLKSLPKMSSKKSDSD